MKEDDKTSLDSHNPEELTQQVGSKPYTHQDVEFTWIIHSTLGASLNARGKGRINTIDIQLERNQESAFHAFFQVVKGASDLDSLYRLASIQTGRRQSEHCTRRICHEYQRRSVQQGINEELVFSIQRLILCPTYPES